MPVTRAYLELKILPPWFSLLCLSRGSSRLARVQAKQLPAFWLAASSPASLDLSCWPCVAAALYVASSSA